MTIRASIPRFYNYSMDIFTCYQVAGSASVFELHGNAATSTCTMCHEQMPTLYVIGQVQDQVSSHPSRHPRIYGPFSISDLLCNRVSCLLFENRWNDTCPANPACLFLVRLIHSVALRLSSGIAILVCCEILACAV